MAAPQQNPSKMVSNQLRSKANDFLNSRKHANNLADILQMFEADAENYTPLLLTIEVIFTELLRRGDLFEDVQPFKLAVTDNTPEGQYKKWLRDCYEKALSNVLECMKRGKTASRLQGLVTACKLMQAEGQHPLESVQGYYFPAVRLKNIFAVLLDSEVSMSAPIARFQEFTEYRDVQQYGLKVLPTLAYRKSPTTFFMQNYLELLDKLLVTEVSPEIKAKDRNHEEKEIKVLCDLDGKTAFTYSAASCRRSANRCWGFACQWPLRSDARTHRRALLVLIERLMPLLVKPQLTTDMLCDSLDAGGPISMLALQGVLSLVQQHNIDYPDIYNRLYAMFEPEIFATRYKRRLMHLGDVFLSSTHLPESMVAAFAKRLSRLALVASPEDAASLLQLVTNLMQRHPALKRMICYEDTPHIMSADPYMMEERCANASRALGSSLWEVCALRRHAIPELATAARQVLAAHESNKMPDLQVPSDDQLFDTELKKRFKAIELNFMRPQGMALPSGERLLHYWDIMA